MASDAESGSTRSQLIAHPPPRNQLVTDTKYRRHRSVLAYWLPDHAVQLAQCRPGLGVGTATSARGREQREWANETTRPSDERRISRA